MKRLYQQNVGIHQVVIEEGNAGLCEVALVNLKGRHLFAIADNYPDAEKIAYRIARGINDGRRFNYEPR